MSSELIHIGTIKKPKGLKKRSKRLGRGVGSGRGKTSGKGHKGAKARSGGGVYNPGYEGGQMPLVRRIPKRGFTNKWKKTWNIVNIGTFDRIDSLKECSSIDKNVLLDKKIISKKKLPLKILGKGLIKRSLQVEADAFSENARKAIEDAGGKVIIVNTKQQGSGK